MKKEIIRINNLSYKVKDGDEEKMLLNNISISFEMPEIITISGPSGSGKTTFLYAISGMLDNLKGEIYIEEKNILACTKKEREKIRLNDISIIFQNLNLFSFMNVEDNILLPYYIKERTVNEKTCQLMNEYLTIMNLAGINKRDIHSLSGGEQQRVAIARAVAKNPKILLCDEPTGALDYKTGKQILKLLQDTCRENNMTVIIVTHNAALAPMADKVIHFKNGTAESVEINANPLPVEQIEW